MLKFLDNRPLDKSPRSPIKFKPEMAYGISIESPSAFQTPFTIVNQNTYVSPYLELEKKREANLRRQQVQLVKPLWTRKSNLQMIEEQKIIASKMEDLKLSPKSRYSTSYKQELNQNKERFRITRGEFTNFIDKNNHYKSIGPLHGQERTSDRIEITKKTVWLKLNPSCISIQHLQQSAHFKQTRQHSQTRMIRNTVENSSIFQKRKIRNNRNVSNLTFQQQIANRKKLSPYKFQLPSLHAEIVAHHHLKRVRKVERNSTNEDSKSLENFELKLKKMFR